MQPQSVAQPFHALRAERFGDAREPGGLGLARRARRERLLQRIELRILAGIAPARGRTGVLLLDALVAEQAPAEDQREHREHAVPGVVRLELLAHGPAEAEPAREVG